MGAALTEIADVLADSDLDNDRDQERTTVSTITTWPPALPRHITNATTTAARASTAIR